MDRITRNLVRASIAPRLVPLGCGAAAALAFLLFAVLCFVSISRFVGLDGDL